MNIFIDTNIFLNIYHFSGDDLIELDKLSVLLRNGKAVLFLPEQVKDEFYRNRDSKIADALKEFRKEKLDRQFPQLTKQYDEYRKMREAIRSFEENKQTILEKLKADIKENNLKADMLINELFSNAHLISLSDEILKLAKTRFDLGRPPGKNKSYGDAINWESLLKTVPNDEELFLITDDGDYISEVDNNNFNPYLFDEWKRIKKSSIFFFKNLTGFFLEKFPDIKLVDEYEKNLLIEKLSKSPNFATTHSILAQLSNFESFSKEQVDNIILASVSNSQIYWISKDQDIKDTLDKIVKTHIKIIDDDLFATFNEIYNPVDETDFF